MPIIRKENNWYWINKAKANKLKEEQTKMNNEMPAFALTLLHAVTNTHIMHLRANSTATHLALGEFYPQLEDLVDSLVESYQGKYGQIMEYGTAYEAPANSPVEYMIGLAEYVQNNRVDLPQDSYIQNIVDEIVQSITSTLHKLRFYK